MTGLNHAASIHFLAAIDNGGYFEGDVSKSNQFRDELVDNPGDDRPGRQRLAAREAGPRAGGERGIPGQASPHRGSWICMRTLLARRCFCAVSVGGKAQTYPNKPIRWIVPYTGGGITDVVTRVVTQKMPGALGQPIVVDNRPGANSILGSDLAAKAAPDGYTMLTVIAGYAANVDAVPGQAAVRPGEGPGAGLARRHRAADPHRQQQLPGEGREGADRLRQGQSRQDELRLLRHRRRRAPHHRAAQADRRASTWSTCRSRAPRPRSRR